MSLAKCTTPSSPTPNDDNNNIKNNNNNNYYYYYNNQGTPSPHAMPTTPHQQPQLLSVSGSRNGNGPAPIDNATCVSIFVGSLKDAREKTRELLSKGTPTGENAMLKTGITLDLSHKKIANIPLEVIELIKDEIERSVQAHSCRPFFQPLQGAPGSFPRGCASCVTPKSFECDSSGRKLHLTTLGVVILSQTRSRTQSAFVVPRRVCQPRPTTLPEPEVQLSERIPSRGEESVLASLWGTLSTPGLPIGRSPCWLPDAAEI